MTKLLAAVGSARIGKKWQCPAHATSGEHAVSLRLDQGEDGRLLLFCHAGCGWKEILRALALPGTALLVAPPTPPDRHARAYLRKMRFPAPKSVGSPSERGYRFEVEHGYGDPEFAWKVRLRHPKTGEKELSWESLNPHGERVYGLLGRRQADFPLYCEREIRMAMAAEEVVVLVESESSADALSSIGIYATTWAGGAADPPIARIAELLGSYPNALMIADNDKAGLACKDKLVNAKAIANVLLGETGEDARDLLKRLGPVAFRSLLTETLR